MADCLEPGSWNVDMEVNLFHAMRGHKPVGKSDKKKCSYD